MKINLQESFELIKLKQPGLTLFQFEKYWQWYLEIQSSQHTYLSKQQVFNSWIAECQSGKPIGHILGQWGFFKDVFFVDDSTMIPRPETELMVEKALAIIDRPMQIAEIGVGSGAVLLSVMLYSKYKLTCTATDISKDAINLCQKNFHSKQLRLNQHNWNFICTDRALTLAKESYDLILCNPPYIPQNHPGVSSQVRNFEPALALYLTENLYEEWMKGLVHGIINCLKPNGIALIEGHEDKLQELQKIIPNNIKVEILMDLNHLQRFMLLKK